VLIGDVDVGETPKGGGERKESTATDTHPRDK
jgi:hypothetical protein